MQKKYRQGLTANESRTHIKGSPYIGGSNIKPLISKEVCLFHGSNDREEYGTNNVNEG